MPALEVVRNIQLKATATGFAEAQRALQGLEKAHGGVAVASDKTKKATLSVERAVNRIVRRYDEQARATQDLVKVEQTLERAVSQGAISLERRNQLMGLAQTRLVGAASANDNLAKSTGLATHEVGNLRAQLLDVFTSLQGGQNPFTVLSQQGPQVAEVFANTSASVGGLAAQLGRFAMVAAPIAAVTAAVVEGWTAWGRYEEAQKAVTVALSGLGRQSGVTRDQINSVAETSAKANNISIASARDLASAFTATGRIGGEIFPDLIKVTKDYAFTTGQELPAAAKELAQAFADPIKGAEVLSEKFGVLDAKQRLNIASMVAAGQQLEAQKALLGALPAGLAKATDATSRFALAWGAVKNAVEAADIAIGKTLTGKSGTAGEQVTRRDLAADFKQFAARQNAAAMGAEAGPAPDQSLNRDLRAANAAAPATLEQIDALIRVRQAEQKQLQDNFTAVQRLDGAYNRHIDSINAVTVADRALVAAETAMADAQQRNVSLIEQADAGARAAATVQAEATAQAKEATRALQEQQEMVRAEIEAVGMSTKARAVYLAGIRAEIEARNKMPREEAARFRNEAIALAELQNQLARETAAKQASTSATLQRASASDRLRAALQAEEDAYWAASEKAGMSPIDSNWNATRDAGSAVAATPEQIRAAEEMFGGHGEWRLRGSVNSAVGGSVGADFIPNIEGLEYSANRSRPARETTQVAPQTAAYTVPAYAAPDTSTAYTPPTYSTPLEQVAPNAMEVAPRPDAYALRNPSIYYGSEQGNYYGETSWVESMSSTLRVAEQQLTTMQSIAANTERMAAAMDALPAPTLTSTPTTRGVESLQSTALNSARMVTSWSNSR